MENNNGSNNIIGEGSVLKGNLNTSGNVRKKRVVKKKPANTSTTTRRTRKTTPQL